MRGAATPRSALPVSHAFHTIDRRSGQRAAAGTLTRLGLRPPRLPIVANVDGRPLPDRRPASVPEMLDILARQVASPVQFVKGLHTLYDEGARVFVEVGPKKALQGFADRCARRRGVVSLATNHPKVGDIVSFNQALCGLYAAGLGSGAGAEQTPRCPTARLASVEPQPAPARPAERQPTRRTAAGLLATVRRAGPAASAELRSERSPRGRQRLDAGAGSRARRDHRRRARPAGHRASLRRRQPRLGCSTASSSSTSSPPDIRDAILDKHITRLVKRDEGGHLRDRSTAPRTCIKLAGRGGAFDLDEEFGVDAERARGARAHDAAGDRRRHRRPARRRHPAGPALQDHDDLGTQLPDRWGLPDELRDDTGVIFASAFPGLEELADEAHALTAARPRAPRAAGRSSSRCARAWSRPTEPSTALAEVDRRIHDLRHGDRGRIPTRSTAASSSASCRWATRSSPS